MKQLLIGILFLGVVFLNSCLNITEEIRLNENGSGQYQLSFDFKGLYETSSLEAIMEEMTWDERNLGGQRSFESIDTVIHFKDLIAGRRGEFQYPELWDKAKLHTKYDRYQKELVFEIVLDFDQLSDIDAFYEDLDKVQSVSNLGSGEIADNGNPDLKKLSFISGTLFEMGKKSFIRHPINTLESQIDPNQIQFLKQFMPNATYKTIYHLPGKVKKTTILNSKIQDNVLTAEYPLLDIYEGETSLQGEIKFK